MNRATDYLDHMLEAAQLASSYIDGMEQAEFFADKRTQQATIRNLVPAIRQRANELSEQEDVRPRSTSGNETK